MMDLFKTKNRQRRVQDLPKNKQTFSYYSSGRPADKSVDTKSKSSKLPGFIKYLPSLFALLAILYGATYLFTLSTDPKILFLKSNSQTSFIRPDQEYQTAARQILQSSILNRNKATLDTKNLINKLQEKFPEIDSISVSLHFLRRRPVINLHSASLGLLLETPQQTLLVNKDGNALMEASEISELSNLNLPSVKDQSGLEVRAGQKVLNASNVGFITELVGQLASQNLKTDSIILPPLPEELHVRLSGKLYYIKFDLKSDAKVAVGTLLATIAKLESDRVVPGEYLDVRVEGKAFYR